MNEMNNNDRTKDFNRKIEVEMHRIEIHDRNLVKYYPEGNRTRRCWKLRFKLRSPFHLQQPNRRESAWFTLAISHRIIGNRKILIRRKISSHPIGTRIRTI